MNITSLIRVFLELYYRFWGDKDMEMIGLFLAIFSVTIRYIIHNIYEYSYSTKVFSTDPILQEFSTQTLISGMFLSQTPRRGFISRALGLASS